MADKTLGSSASAVFAHPELSIHDGTVTTTSLQVAQTFGKRHRDVLRVIRSLIAEMPEDHARNFARMVHVVEIDSGASREEEVVRMTRDGFMLLAMGFTGKEALRWKLAYIAAFNRIEVELQKPAYDPARIQLAHSLAAKAAAQVTQTVFDAIASGRDSDWRRVRYLLPRRPAHHPPGAGGGGRPDGHLPECAHQLSERAQVRELRAATKASAAPATTSTAVAAPIPPHIGHDGKPLPPGTFRAVFV